MATWQLGGLPSMVPQNDNAPRSSVPQPVQFQQQPNVGLMALQGLRGVAEINQQARQQQRKAEFQKAYAGAFGPSIRQNLTALWKENPAGAGFARGCKTRCSSYCRAEKKGRLPKGIGGVFDVV